ncbi:melatonin receptor type 1A-like [Anneissia japonica]|uniref:melatonin receptor type 1A-like n=1 Tax=Anneissia japonica TaxID=1529436 RepID=UPI001425AB0D|nr:melatonin receptor type 1A-like [Anneissia japonica]
MVISVTIVAVIGIIGNVMTILAVLTNKLIRQNTANFFVINLAISDLIIASIICPDWIVSLIYRRSVFPQIWCTINGSIITILSLFSIFNLFVIALSRFVYVVYNKFYAKMFTRNLSLAMCVFTWILSFALYFLFNGENLYIEFHKGMLICGFPKATGKKVFILGAICIINMCLVALFYGIIFRFIVKSRMRTGNQVNPNTSVVKTFFIVFTMYTLTFMPCMIMRSSTTEPEKWTLLWQACLFVFISNSCMNPFIYSWRNKIYRQTFHKFIKCQFK